MGDDWTWLIITGDDFGYCVHRDQGLLQAFQAGRLSAASLLVTSPRAPEAVCKARRVGLPLGLHVNVTEGKPVADLEQLKHDSRVPSLLGPDGTFLGKHGFRQRLEEGGIDLDEVEKEIEAQILRFVLLVGGHPKHVDGHQHFHILPGVNSVFARVLHDHGILRTRLPVEVDVNSCSWLDPTRKKFFAQVSVQAILSAPIFKEYGLRWADAFVGLSTTGAGMDVDLLGSVLRTALTAVKNGNLPSCKLHGKEMTTRCEDITALSGTKTRHDRWGQTSEGNWMQEMTPCRVDTQSSIIGMEDCKMSHGLCLELMVHPGLACSHAEDGYSLSQAKCSAEYMAGYLHDGFCCSPEREFELRVLVSLDFQNLLEKLGLKIMGADVEDGKNEEII
uniref:Carbohydrate deacetylase n=1 Tax=Eptatretus burgeri TaxID=7764 RepID=A0A8C4QZ34_EPTBU